MRQKSWAEKYSNESLNANQGEPGAVLDFGWPPIEEDEFSIF